jgi:chaperonin GroES
MKVDPLFDRALVREIEPSTVSAGGIMLLDTANSGCSQGEVVAVGPGRRTKDGSYVGMAVQVGDIVLYKPTAGDIVTFNGEELLMMSEGEMLARLCKE